MLPREYRSFDDPGGDLAEHDDRPRQVVAGRSRGARARDFPRAPEPAGARAGGRARKASPAKRRWTAAIADSRGRASVSLPKTLASTTRSGPDTFLVTYVGRTPEETQRVTNRLATAFIEQHSKLRETRAEDTSAFLAAQLDQSRDRLKSHRGASAPDEGSLHGPPAGADTGEPADGRRPSPAAGEHDDVAAQRAGSAGHARAADRSDEDRAPPKAPLSRAGGAATAQERIADASAAARRSGVACITDKHPEIQRLKGEIATAEALAEGRARASGRRARAGAERRSRPTVSCSPSGRPRACAFASTSARSPRRGRDRQVSGPGRNGADDRAAVELRSTASTSSRSSSTPASPSAISLRCWPRIWSAAAPASNSRCSIRRFARSQPSSPDVPRVLLLSLLAGTAGRAACWPSVASIWIDPCMTSRALQNEFELPVLAEIPRIATR